MKKKLILGFFICSMFLGLTTKAMADTVQYKIAIVNIPEILAASKSLKSAQDTKVKQEEEMIKWFNTASAEINKQTTKAQKDALVKKYEAQLVQKKKNIKDTYAKKISEIDSQMNTAITQKAKAMGYNIVLKKDSTIFGGDDITKSVIPLIK